jgi:hypothetical protein
MCWKKSARRSRNARRLERRRRCMSLCYTKDHRGSVTQIKEPILPPIDFTKEVYKEKVSDSSTSVTREDISAMFSEHAKFTRDMVGEEVTKGLTKFSQNSKYHP